MNQNKPKNYVGVRTLLALLMITSINGCSSTTSTTTTPTSTVVIPKVGTSWTFYYVLMDTLGTKIVKQDTTTRTVVATNVHYLGDTDVVMTVETYKTLPMVDTTYIRYLPSGDISRATDATLLPQFSGWFTIPYATHLTQFTPLSENIAGANTEHDTASFSVNWVSEQTETVAATNYQASTITSTIWQHITSAVKDSTYSLTTSNSFIPQYGIFGNRSVTAFAINGKKRDLGHWTLVAVNIK